MCNKNESRESGGGPGVVDWEEVRGGCHWWSDIWFEEGIVVRGVQYSPSC
jgi:hypothetical protein